MFPIKLEYCGHILHILILFNFNLFSKFCSNLSLFHKLFTNLLNFFPFCLSQLFMLKSSIPKLSILKLLAMFTRYLETSKTSKCLLLTKYFELVFKANCLSFKSFIDTISVFIILKSSVFFQSTIEYPM